MSRRAVRGGWSNGALAGAIVGVLVALLYGRIAVSLQHRSGTAARMNAQSPSLSSSLVRGIAASVAGTSVMTAFQLLVEMPVTGRGESVAPAKFAHKVLPIGSHEPLTHRQVNYLAHYGIGTLWGMAFAIAGRIGLHGQKAVHTVFPTVLIGDILLNTALGLYQPSTWSKQDWVVDILDKYVQAQTTSAVYDRLDQS